jgi:hypothetical protein
MLLIFKGVKADNILAKDSTTTKGEIEAVVEDLIDMGALDKIS